MADEDQHRQCVFALLHKSDRSNISSVENITKSDDSFEMCYAVGQLYQSIVDFEPRGSLQRAFHSAVQLELRQYETTVYDLHDSISIHKVVQGAHTTWMDLQLLAVLCQSRLYGSDLLVGLQRHLQSNHIQRNLLERLLQATLKPYYHMLHQWVTQGELVDPNDEFFIVPTNDNSNTLLFVIQDNRRPIGILDETTIQEIYNVGKAIHYVRHQLLDYHWKCNAAIFDPNNQLSNFLQATSKTVHSHILSSLRKTHQLELHLTVLKQFLLVCQGDFFLVLLEQLPVTNDAAAILDAAWSTTNASQVFPKHVWERLELTTHPNNNDNHTNVNVSMRYHLPEPLQAIAHPTAMEHYQTLFQFLFRIKQVEFQSDIMWRQGSVLQRALINNAVHLNLTPSTDEAYGAAIRLLRQLSVLRQSVRHCTGNLQRYLFSEVVERGWKTLQEQVQTAETLDDLVRYHDGYLRTILHKCLLQSADLKEHIDKLLTFASDFCMFQQELFASALEAAGQAAQRRRQAEYNMAKGSAWGYEVEAVEQESCFGLSDTSKLVECDWLKQEFNQNMHEFLKLIDFKLHGSPAWATDHEPRTPTKATAEAQEDDLDCLRPLALQLDNNQFYNVSSL